VLRATMPFSRQNRSNMTSAGRGLVWTGRLMGRCATSCFAVRSADGGAALGSQILRDGVSLGDDGTGLFSGDGGAVDVAQAVRLPGALAGDAPVEQGGRDVAERRVVVFAGGDH
jgi:hypothetical protein